MFQAICCLPGMFYIVLTTVNNKADHQIVPFVSPCDGTIENGIIVPKNQWESLKKSGYLIFIFLFSKSLSVTTSGLFNKKSGGIHCFVKDYTPQCQEILTVKAPNLNTLPCHLIHTIKRDSITSVVFGTMSNQYSKASFHGTVFFFRRNFDEFFIT